MELISDIKDIEFPLKNNAVTIGNFDGVHNGHIALFDKVKKEAKKLGGKSVCITFNPHPLKIIKSKHSFSLITLYEQKIELIKKTGVDVLISIPFTKEFANIGAESFVKNILVEKIGTKFIVVGKDYNFGKNREGNIEFLKELSKKYNFDVCIPDWIKTKNGEKISSTIIRKFIKAGDIEKVCEFLGHLYQIIGKVEEGEKLGTKLGFPTANIKVCNELFPKRGVYFVKVHHQNKIYKGILNAGFKPTFNKKSEKKFVLEVHILNFDKQIYGDFIKVDFVSRLRDEKKFNSSNDLVKQIKEDIKVAKLWKKKKRSIKF